MSALYRTPAARDSWKKISITLKVSDFFWQDRTCNSTATRCNTSINIYGKSWDWEKSFDQQIARAQNTSLIWSHYFVPIELCQTSHDLGQELRLCDPPVPCPGAVQFQSDRFALISNLGFSVNNVDSSTTGKTVSSTYSSTVTIYCYFLGSRFVRIACRKRFLAHLGGMLGYHRNIILYPKKYFHSRKNFVFNWWSPSPSAQQPWKTRRSRKFLKRMSKRTRKDPKSHKSLELSRLIR